jgi:hypothetical protein
MNRKEEKRREEKRREEKRKEKKRKEKKRKEKKRKEEKRREREETKRKEMRSCCQSTGDFDAFMSLFHHRHRKSSPSARGTSGGNVAKSERSESVNECLGLCWRSPAIETSWRDAGIQRLAWRRGESMMVRHLDIAVQ